jgi:phosphate starvation-inducible PhoH-like protein
MKYSLDLIEPMVAKNLCGINNSNLKILEEILDCSIDFHCNSILSDAKDEKEVKLKEMIDLLVDMANIGVNITSRDIVYSESVIDNGVRDKFLNFLKNRKPIGYTNTGKPVYAKTLKQNYYVDALNKKDLIFSVGSAGTGKTYLAVVYAITQLKKGNVEKIILTRPAVEAGESLGFLPGDLKEKVDPYLRPLYDALYDMLGVEQTNILIEKNIIEIAPLAYMRGRTLENAFIILDEAQNATIDQLKMFLTRLGFNSKMIITGDISQVDLPNSKKSGLKPVANLLKGLSEVSVIEFEKYDVVRHPLVAKIIEKFEHLS